MIEAKILQAEKRFKELSERLIHPDTFANSAELQKLSKEHADLEPLAHKIDEFRKTQKERDEASHLAKGDDPEMKALAESELPLLEKKIEEVEKELKTLLLPKDPNGDRNALFEIRAGTGGGEAALFAADLFRMYSRYRAHRHEDRAHRFEPHGHWWFQGDRVHGDREERFRKVPFRERYPPGPTGPGH